MKKIAFIQDFFKEDLLGGAENNDGNLINFLLKNNEVDMVYSYKTSPEELSIYDSIIVSNFIHLGEDSKKYLINEREYIIYEHDHKYVNTRDPSVFPNFIIPSKNIVNREFYQSSKEVVVLSKICKQVLENTLPKTKVHSIGCSLWSDETFDYLSNLSQNPKNGKTCVMKSSNPIKNYPLAVKYCEKNNISFDAISSNNTREFLELMSSYSSFLFLPGVLETYSRICAEAKMMDLQVLTNKNKIGFFSEDISTLSGKDLIEKMKSRVHQALLHFGELV